MIETCARAANLPPVAGAPANDSNYGERYEPKGDANPVVNETRVIVGG